jgi:hypothetical protein
VTRVLDHEKVLELVVHPAKATCVVSSILADAHRISFLLHYEKII